MADDLLGSLRSRRRQRVEKISTPLYGRIAFVVDHDSSVESRIREVLGRPLEDLVAKRVGRTRKIKHPRRIAKDIPPFYVPNLENTGRAQRLYEACSSHPYAEFCWDSDDLVGLAILRSIDDLDEKTDGLQGRCSVRALAEYLLLKEKKLIEGRGLDSSRSDVEELKSDKKGYFERRSKSRVEREYGVTIDLEEADSVDSIREEILGFFERNAAEVKERYAPVALEKEDVLQEELACLDRLTRKNHEVNDPVSVTLESQEVDAKVLRVNSYVWGLIKRVTVQTDSGEEVTVKPKEVKRITTPYVSRNAGIGRTVNVRMKKRTRRSLSGLRDALPRIVADDHDERFASEQGLRREFVDSLLTGSYNSWVGAMFQTLASERKGELGRAKKEVTNTRKRIKSIDKCLEDFRTKCSA